jgi:hypothetical protein
LFWEWWRGRGITEEISYVADLLGGAMKRKCQHCGRTLELNQKNFYRNKKKAGGFQYGCKRCLTVRQAARNKIVDCGEEDNAFVIMHRWLECVFSIARTDFENQLAIFAAIGGVYSRGF